MRRTPSSASSAIGGSFGSTMRLSRAVEQGEAGAQFQLGVLYANGQGVPQNYEEAVQWYRRAAEQGEAVAQFNLGVKYDNGQGVPQNYEVAGQWYRRAAEQGHARAQSNLGVLYAQGQGLPQDFIRAYMWLTIAAAASRGDDVKTATKNQNYVTSHMTAAQIGKAQEMARRCQQSQFKECD